MPEAHKAVYGWNSERFLSWAEKIGPHTKELIQCVLDSREYPVQTYRSCMGIMRLCKNHPKEIMEKASREAIDKKICSYKYLAILVKQVTTKGPQKNPEIIIRHDHVRGSSAYTGGGLRV